MSVQNAGAVIKSARIKSGLSQAKLADGICSALSLSRIEQGKFGVSPSTFQALMTHMGIPCEAYPTFASRTDFDCFYTLKRAAFYLDSWQLTFACKELDSVEQMNWAENKYYYQEWLYLQSRLQFRSGSNDHELIYEYVISALHISRPEFNQSEIRTMLLSITEIKLLIQLAQEFLYLNHMDECLEICQQIATYLANSQLSFLEKDRLTAENAIVYAKYLIATEDYENALQEANTNRQQMVADRNDSSLHELTYLTALASYYKKDLDHANELFQTAFYSAHSIESCYATICLRYSKEHISLDYSDYLLDLPEIPLPEFQTKKIIDTTSFGDGTYDMFSTDALSLGELIKELRTEQKISQSTLCQGICSKSKLSKIENGTQDMDIILAETLLQRLGINDRVFTFYGDERSTNLNELKSKITISPAFDKKIIENLLLKMKSLISNKDTLYQQYILYRHNALEANNVEKEEFLKSTLHTTLPNFNINHILDYRLSSTELNILNNLSYCYAKHNSVSNSIQLYHKIFEYLTLINLDIMFRARFIPITLAMLVYQLYMSKSYSQLIDLIESIDSTNFICSISFSANIFSNLCQAYVQSSDLKKAIQFTHYAISNHKIIEQYEIASQVEDCMQNEHHIIL